MELGSLIVGGILLFGGACWLLAGFFYSAVLTTMFGDEFMVDADLASFAVGKRAVRIKESKHIGIAFILMALLGCYYALMSHDWTWAWLIGLFAGTGCMRLGQQMVPGSIIVLGYSGRTEQATLTLQAHINRTLKPLRAVSLLKAEFGDDDELIRSSCYRVGKGDDWVAAVECFCTLLPLVILDLRITSEQVKKELMIVLEERYDFKTIFVGSDADLTSILDCAKELDVGISASELVCVHDHVQCVEMIGNVLLNERRRPTRSQPLCQLVREANSQVGG